ncbi:putative metalloprotease CJM1_0395 family protein [Arsukibacterium sp.]|uniref:putative metalloprotease CJM1_0395 family protein n=1 Tax=Arsukibacterium sp. TaxID=1977258 RepID=UPI00299E3B1E|nr:putative metalloprotease CJM1_0395 family protein [Arsukibacterium sp.]MDX1676331.1 putative metalloprotease CJM1_0395 family protein [Arsukibacterium sp.]
MQITSYYPNVSINTANPPTELARRDMQRRELVDPVREADKGKPERAVATEEKGRSSNPAGQVSGYDSNGKATETQQAVEGRPDSSQDDSRQQQQSEAEQRQEQAEQQEIRELQSRDQEVRSHEQAHASIGGRYAGAPSYSYELGPDGRQYAVAGEVQIDIAPVPGDPQATIQKMQQVKAAALAPAEPSSADRRIAAEASQRLLQAQAELVAEKTAPPQTTAVTGNSTETAAPAAAAIDDSQIRYDSETRGRSGSVAGLVFPELDTLAQMQQRSQIISRFYQLATEPAQRPLRQQA